ncbi:hypothetical protein D9M70_315100 [compost metagenome]
MTKLSPFKPRSHADSTSNLNAFISYVRDKITPLSSKNQFDKNYWNVAGLISKGGATKFIYFSQLGVDAKKNKTTKSEPSSLPDSAIMREPFLSYAKAILAYLHAFKRSKSITCRLLALRFIERALWEVYSDASPTLITPEIMDRACNIARDPQTQTLQSSYGSQLRIIYEATHKLGILDSSCNEWRPSLPRSSYSPRKTGAAFEQERNKRLPSPLALDALAEIFNLDNTDNRETFTSSMCALMICAPERSAELLFSPLNLLGPDWTDPETGEVGCSLRWFPVKNGLPHTKTVIPQLYEVAKRAVVRLSKLSEPARALAVWYEENLNKIFLPPELEYLRDKDKLSLTEAHNILFGASGESLSRLEAGRALHWLKRYSVERVSNRRGGTTVSLASLEKAILGLLPEGFPIMDDRTGMRYSEALCLIRTHEFGQRSHQPMICCFDRARYNVLAKSLKSTKLNKSIFERRGYVDDNGTFLTLTTHQIRHYLSTLVSRPGTLTDIELAKWSGRTNTRQNQTYIHESDKSIITKLRSALGDPSQSVGPFANINERLLIRREEFSSIKIITAHTTEHGYCIHDFIQSPCLIHNNCMACDEFLCIKGDTRAEENIRSTQRELLRLQAEAESAFSAEVLGAAEWYAYQSKQLERVNEIISILDNPSIPMGAIIQLEGTSPPSRLAMAAQTRTLPVIQLADTNEHDALPNDHPRENPRN